MCIFSPDDFPTHIIQGYRAIADKFNHFSVGEGRQAGNVLANLDYNNINVIVNAGDPKSGKGNGMSKDFTVEGFIVANAGGFNPQCKNTSFTHNPRFNNNITDTRSWVRL